MPIPSSSFCEVCGRQVNETVKTVIEGSIFRVCSQCSRRGKPLDSGITESHRPSSSTFRQPIAKNKPAVRRLASNRLQLIDETVLSRDFGRMIREARVKKGFTHEQLGTKMSEKASLLRKVETGALKPDELLAKKLERYLQIKLYVSADDQQE